MPLGVGVSQPPAALLQTADALSQKYFAKVLVDAVFKPSPSWWRITRRGRRIQGGSAIVVPVAYQEETAGGAYWGAQLLDTTPFDSVRPAQWEWKFYYQPIVIPYTDVLLNAGPTQVLDLIRVKEEIAMGSLLQKLSRALYKVAPQNTPQDLDSLVDAVATDNNTYAGIDRAQSANAFWRPVVINNPSGGVTLANLMDLYGRVTYGNEEPDTILTTQAGFNALWNIMVAQIRYPDPDEETNRAGFRRHLVFNNAVVLHDQFTPAGQLYMLNTKYTEACFHEDDYFTVDPFTKPSGQRVLISGIYVAMNLKVFNPRMEAAYTGLSNA